MIKTISILLVGTFSLAAWAGILKCGEYVVDTYHTGRPIKKITAMASDGTVRLEDGQWYDRSYLKTLIPSYNGIEEGEMVEEIYHTGRNLRAVRRIAEDGTFLLSDDQWYDSSYVRSLKSSMGRFHVGENVVDVYHTQRPIKQITHIDSDGNLQLTDGDWYDQSYVKTLVQHYRGISIGQQVVETYHSERSIRTVLHIAEDGTFQLSDGQWYDSSYVQTLICDGACN